jgi:hypothetical protein
MGPVPQGQFGSEHPMPSRTNCPLRALQWAVLFACVWLPPAAQADEEELRALKQQVEELKRTVTQLQDRVQVLERREAPPWVAATPEGGPPSQPNPISAKPVEAGQSSTQSAAPAAKSSVDDKIVVLRNSWRRISGEMTQAAVKESLGPPTREMLINGKTVWYYYYAGLGAGSVFFRGDGRVSSSQPPNLGWGF